MWWIGFGSSNGGVGLGVSVGSGVVWLVSLFVCDSGDIKLDSERGVLAVSVARNLGSSGLVAESLVGAIVMSMDWT